LKKKLLPWARVAGAKKIPGFGGMKGFEWVKNTHQPNMTLFFLPIISRNNLI